MDSSTSNQSEQNSDGWVKIHVDGVSFETRRTTLTRHSKWFQNYFSMADSPAIVRLDCNANMFESIMKFMRRGIYPMFFDPRTALLDLVKYRELLEEARYLGIHELVHYVESGSYGFQRLEFPPHEPEAIRVGGLVATDEMVKQMDGLKSASSVGVGHADTLDVSSTGTPGGSRGSARGRIFWPPIGIAGLSRGEQATVTASMGNGAAAAAAAAGSTHRSALNQKRPIYDPWPVLHPERGQLVDIDDHSTDLEPARPVPAPQTFGWSSRKNLLATCTKKIGENKFVCVYPRCNPNRLYVSGSACKTHIRAVHKDALANLGA